MDKHTLVMQGICKSFHQGTTLLSVLNNISITFETQKTYAITGVSGTGKSTFMHVLAGLDTPQKGNVIYDAISLYEVSDKKKELILNQSFGVVFQNPYLISELSVLENIMIPGLISGKSIAECMPKAKQLLDRIGISQKTFAHPAALSGGQQQRVALARALFNEPTFLLADEPTGNLDIQTGKAIVDLIHDCQNEWGMGVIISSHDSYVAETMDKVYKLAGGKLNRI